jgi:hypothetical protein
MHDGVINPDWLAQRLAKMRATLLKIEADPDSNLGEIALLELQRALFGEGNCVLAAKRSQIRLALRRRYRHRHAVFARGL